MRNDRRQGVRGSGGRLGTRQKGLDGPPDIFSRSRVVDKLKGSPVVASRFALPPQLL